MTMASIAQLKRQASVLAGPATRRCFSTSGSMQATYGFIGLGRMGMSIFQARSESNYAADTLDLGYPMASNLRAHISKSDTLIVHDLNADTTAKFAQENPGTQIAQNCGEVAEQSVCLQILLFSRSAPQDESFCSIYDLSWGLPRQPFL